jgi:ABC-type thiamin/hydroxymethylpyrimidine transport system permease subunit
MGPITENLYKQIKGWRVYSIIMPAVFAAVSALLFLFYGTPFQNIFYVGLVILSVTCISWWHWSLSTMVTMLAIMKDTDDHFENVTAELTRLRTSIRPELRVIKSVDDKN